MRRRTGALLVAGALLLAGCGGDDGDGVVAGGGTTTTTVASGEPVTVADAVEAPEGTTLTVRGHVRRPDEGATVLCDGLGESFPPVCTEPTLPTDGLDVDGLPGLQSTSGGDLVAEVTWTEEPVEVTGTLTAGRLVVSS